MNGGVNWGLVVLLLGSLLIVAACAFGSVAVIAGAFS